MLLAPAVCEGRVIVSGYVRDSATGEALIGASVMELEGRKTVVVHEHHLVHALAASGDFDIVVYGHTHRPEVRKEGGTLIVNPGKAARLHRGTSTVAILRPLEGEVEIIELFGAP